MIVIRSGRTTAVRAGRSAIAGAGTAFRRRPSGHSSSTAPAPRRCGPTQSRRSSVASVGTRSSSKSRPVRPGTGDASALPETLEAVVARQIDALSRVPRRLLRPASVLGTSFGADLFERVLADDDLVLEWRVIERDSASWSPREHGDRFRFRHTIVRDAAYEGLPYRRRQSLHLRAGEAGEWLRETNAEQRSKAVVALRARR